MSIISRRGILRSSAFAGIAAASSACASNVWAQTDLVPTPECKDNDPPTLPETEGPFYRPRTPERFDLVETSGRGRQVELTGYVLTRGCRPVGRALVDLWHADDGGAYDNRGLRYRGHVFTDEQGRYRFRTITPGPYPGRRGLDAADAADARRHPRDGDLPLAHATRNVDDLGVKDAAGEAVEHELDGSLGLDRLEFVRR